MDEIERIDKVVRHITNVQENCFVLGKKLMENSEADLGRQLIANGFIHDNSKFFGIEWEALHSEDGTDKTKLELAIFNHNSVNKHHPEAWGNIKNMPRLYLAEMVCDWAARAAEFGASLIDWIHGGAMKRYGFTKNTKVYKEIMFFVNLLVDKPFKPIK